MDEVNVHPIDVCDELRQSVEPRLCLMPIVIGPPITNQFLQSRQLHALRLIGDGFPIGPTHCHDPAAQIDQILFRNVRLERSNGVFASFWRIALSIAQRDQTMAEQECDDR